jgi:protein required for attachment to host cells
MTDRQEQTMQTTWIVVADAALARIFAQRSSEGFEEVDALAGPDREDAAGQDLPRAVTAYLDDAHKQQRFDRLCVVAAPAVFGALRDTMSRTVQHAVEADLPPDIAAMSVRQIEDYVGERINLH